MPGAGAPQKFTRVYGPHTTGKAERFIQSALGCGRTNENSDHQTSALLHNRAAPPKWPGAMAVKATAVFDTWSHPFLRAAAVGLDLGPRRPPKVPHLWPPKLLHSVRGDLTH